MVGRKLQGSDSSRGEKNTLRARAIKWNTYGVMLSLLLWRKCDVLFLYLGYLNDKKIFSTIEKFNIVIFYWEGWSKMLEAVKAIKIAEEQLEQEKKQVILDMKSYAEEKNQQLVQQQTENAAFLKKLIAEKEELELQQLNSEKELLLIEAKKVSDELQEQYQQHDREAIQMIIERVKKNYGSY